MAKANKGKAARKRRPRKPLPQFSFMCPGCESFVDAVYVNKPEYNGMTGRHYNTRRMVLACEGCGCVIAERKRAAAPVPILVPVGVDGREFRASLRKAGAAMAKRFRAAGRLGWL